MINTFLKIGIYISTIICLIGLYVIFATDLYILLKMWWAGLTFVSSAFIFANYIMKNI